MVGKRVELEGGSGAMAQWARWLSGINRRGGATAQWWRDSDAVVVWSRRVVAYVLEMMPYGVIGLG